MTPPADARRPRSDESIYKTIYLDTTALMGSQWPRQSLELRIFLTLAKAKAIAVVIPEAVIDERRAQWVIERSEQFAGYQKEHAKLSISSELWGLAAPFPFTSPDQQALGGRFDELSDGIISEWGIQIAATTKTPASRIFELALGVQAAFERKGDKLVGFKDTVILISVLEDMKSRPAPESTFVSNDGVFTKPEVTSFVQSHGVKLSVAEGLAALIPVLRSGLEAADLWATDISEAAEFLRAKNKDLGKFLVNEVATMSLPGGRVTQVNVTDVKDVVTPPVADRKARSDRSVSFSGSLSVLLEDRTDLYTLSSAAPSGYISYGSSAIVEATVEAVVLWDDGYRELKGARLVSATVHRWPVVRESTGGVP